MIEKFLEKFDKTKIVRARMKDLIISVAAWTSCIYEKVDVEFNDLDPVIIKSNEIPEASRVIDTMKIKNVTSTEVLETEIATSFMSAQNGSVTRKYRF